MPDMSEVDEKEQARQLHAMKETGVVKVTDADIRNWLKGASSAVPAIKRLREEEPRLGLQEAVVRVLVATGATTIPEAMAKMNPPLEKSELHRDCPGDIPHHDLIPAPEKHPLHVRALELRGIKIGIYIWTIYRGKRRIAESKMKFCSTALVKKHAAVVARELGLELVLGRGVK